MVDVSRLVGIPYAWDGRTLDGCDCWGLVVLYHRLAHGLEVPGYEGAGAACGRDLRAVAGVIAGGIAPPWTEVTGEPRPGDVVVLRHGRAPSHVGILLSERRMLHAPGPGPSCIVRLDAPLWARRVAGFYRHEALIP